MNRRILVVDDEQDVLDVFTEMLGSLGYKAYGATSANRAFKMMANEEFNLIIIDLIMPQIGGLELLRLIKQQNHFIPIVLTAGVDLDKTPLVLEKHGVNGFIKKPFTINDIYIEVQKHFRVDTYTDKIYFEDEELLSII